jgi:hypothetical protein
MRKFALALLLTAGAAAAPAQESTAPFVVQESGRGFARLQDALRAVGGGDATILIAPGHYRECAVQEGGRISYVAQQPGTAVFDSVVCQGKAGLVLAGRAARIYGLVFENYSVSDGNGSGIRLEQGDLYVMQSEFRDSQSGILSHNDPSATIQIERSTFSGLGYCGADCAHSIYIGDYGRLIVDRSRFERGTGGHYIKTRGTRVDISQSSFDDSGGRATNYMIDLSNGSTGMITGNTFVQGANKENYSGMIVVAAEGQHHSANGLVVAGNDAKLAPGAKPTSFVVDFTGESIDLESNKLASEIRPFETR